MTTPRSETQRVIAALRSAELLAELTEKTLLAMMLDVATIKAAIEAGLEALKGGRS